MRGTLRGTGQRAADKTEGKQSVTRKEIFLPLFHDRNFFFPWLLDENFSRLVTRAPSPVPRELMLGLLRRIEPVSSQLRRTEGKTKENSTFMLKTAVLTYASHLETLMG